MHTLGVGVKQMQKTTHMMSKLSTGSCLSSRARYLISLILLIVGVIGCSHGRGAVVVAPCPVPSALAYSELGTMNECCPGMVEYLGRVELLCDALGEMRSER